MTPTTLSRRAAVLGAVAGLGGCSALSAINAASEPLDTFDLSPASGSTTGRRTSRTLLVARPAAPAAIATDRIMVKPDSVAITYLPEARWSDDLPLVLQSLVIRSISATGRIGYVGQSEGGPVPDAALLVRVDAFQVRVLADGAFQPTVDLTVTLINDRDQRVIASRGFAQSIRIGDSDSDSDSDGDGDGRVTGDSPASVVLGFQGVLDTLLPALADWVVARV